jgi:dethiobiotin synthetase
MAEGQMQLPPRKQIRKGADEIPRLFFITGTDTAVGKTVLTALLLAHARQQGLNALALKPFCSGGRSDALLLHSLMEDSATLDQVNPFHHREPLTPLLCARKRKQTIPIREVTHHIDRLRHRCDLLLIEGAGGLLAPLGENKSAPYSNLTLLKALDCEAIVVAANKLGTINHSLLTVNRLEHEGVRVRSVILSDISKKAGDVSVRHNLALLKELLPSIPVHNLPVLGSSINPASVMRSARKHCILLTEILG